MKHWVQGLVNRDRSQLSKRDAPGGAAVLERLPGGVPALSDRDRGDQARDRKSWAEAAQSYESHLKSRPDDTAIWVQLGHARKESGDHRRAEEAYRTALSLTPDDADIPLQLGHLMKLLGRTREATALYSTALRLEPSSNAYRELVGLGHEAQAERLVSAVATGGTEPTLYLQINDLLHFLRSHQTPSGIQRVQLGFITYGLSGQRAPDDPVFEFVFNQADDARLWKASRARLQRLVGYLTETNVDAVLLRRLVDDVLEDAVLVKPGKGDSFIILGAFWGMPGNTPLMASLREQGVSLGIYLYDLIPITYPEYCDHGLTIAFTRELCEALHFIDFALAISEYTAQEMRSFIRRHGYRDIPIEAVPLAHSLTGTQAPADANDDSGAEWTEAIQELQERDFVLCVCTIEPRKNHQYLYDAWKILKQDGVPVPDLVFVGRRGWHNNDFFVRLENSEYLNGTIKVMHDLSDTELATLYRACRFTVFPSIVEGWGLPVGESLSYGKLCVSSNVTSMPEVGGNFVEYVDPLNLRAGIETLRDLIANPSKVAQWEAGIRERFRPRSWDDVSRQFLSAVARLHASHDSGRKPLVAMLRSGIPLRLGDLHRESNLRPVHDYADLQRLILAEGWYEPEQFGVWMKGNAGTLRFATDLPPGRQVVVYLRLVGAPHTKGLKALFPGTTAQPEELPVSANQSETARLKTAVGNDGRVTIELKVKGHYDTKAHLPRVFCVGLTLLAFVDAEDVAARAELLEQVMLDRR